MYILYLNNNIIIKTKKVIIFISFTRNKFLMNLNLIYYYQCKNILHYIKIELTEII